MRAPLVKTLFAVGVLAFAGAALAQTKLKFAHVYETSEPYHTAAVWAAEEIKKRTNGRYEIEVFPASQLGKETDINQGLTLGTVDIIYTGQAFAARTYAGAGHRRRAVHVPRPRPLEEVRRQRAASRPDGGLLQEGRQQAAGHHLLRRAPHHRRTRRSRSPRT